ncbi:MAG: thioredoxin family protein [Bacteroidota bacterium]
MKSLTQSLTLCLLVLLFACQPAADNSTAAADEDTTAQTVSDDKQDDTPTEGIEVGDQAPTFNLKSVDGEMYSFDNIKDANGETPKGFIVTFTCNTCPYAVDYEDRIIALHNKMSPQGYPVVAIQPNDPAVKDGDSFESMQTRAQEKGFPFLYLNDGAQEVYPKYGATRTPEVFLVDADGIVRYQGAIDDNHQEPAKVTVNYVETAVAAIEAGRDPEPSFVKAIGCTIKTKKT